MGRTVKPFFCLFLSFFAFPTVLGLLHQPLPSLLFLVLPAGAGGCASRPKLAQRMYSPSSTPVIPTEVPRSLRHAAEGSRQPTLSHHHPRTSTRFYRAARAATAPAAAPIANHFAARPTRRHIDPPLAACRGTVAFLSHCLGLGLLVLQVRLCRRQSRLALPAIHRKVVQRLQILFGHHCPAGQIRHHRRRQR